MRLYFEVNFVLNHAFKLCQAFPDLGAMAILIPSYRTDVPAKEATDLHDLIIKRYNYYLK